MLLREIWTKHDLGKIRKFLAQKPIYNVLLLGDSYSPQLGLSTLYIAEERGIVVGACSLYRGFTKPSVVLSTATPEIKKALLNLALKHVRDEFTTLCNPDEIELFEAHAKAIAVHSEWQMVAKSIKNTVLSNITVERVRKEALRELNRFYVEHNSEAWIPFQFRVGPFYCVRVDNGIVSAAGTHLKTPQIAHLGNIVTDEAYRRQGFATACTSTLAHDLLSKGQIVSLFVRTENEAAINLYEKIGFKRMREIAFMTAKKNLQVTSTIF
jgi:ribosomal protein S18 acetylase RimI-like enzyme